MELGEENKSKGISGTNDRIHPEYPFLKSEIAYAVRHEMAEKPNDVLCRRVPIGFLNKQVAEEMLPEVVEIMAREKKWNGTRKEQEMKEAKEMLQYLK